MTPPERRRALIIGAGPTGMSAAFHLGEHSLLLERRLSLEHSHDYSNGFPMGAAHGSTLGGENARADGNGFATPAENKTLFISCSSRSQTDAGQNTLIHVERWRAPDLAKQNEALRPQPSVRTLMPLLRGELRLGAQVTHISPSSHLLELADGHRYVYDKLLSTLSLAATERLLSNEVPGHVHHDESLRYWLSAHDIELADRDVQEYNGDIDGFAMGKRFADQIGLALALKFGKSRSAVGSARLFEPRLVMP